jgi:hypothetical protein
VGSGRIEHDTGGACSAAAALSPERFAVRLLPLQHPAQIAAGRPELHHTLLSHAPLVLWEVLRVDRLLCHRTQRRRFVGRVGRQSFAEPPQRDSVVVPTASLLVGCDHAVSRSAEIITTQSPRELCDEVVLAAQRRAAVRVGIRWAGDEVGVAVDGSVAGGDLVRR